MSSFYPADFQKALRERCSGMSLSTVPTGGCPCPRSEAAWGCGSGFPGATHRGAVELRVCSPVPERLGALAWGLSPGGSRRGLRGPARHGAGQRRPPPRSPPARSADRRRGQLRPARGRGAPAGRGAPRHWPPPALDSESLARVGGGGPRAKPSPW